MPTLRGRVGGADLIAVATCERCDFVFFLPNVVGMLSRRRFRFLLVKGRTLRHEALLDSFKFRQVANATWPGQLMGAPQSRYSAGCRSESALEPLNWNEATIRNPAQMRQTGAQWIDRIING